MHHIFSNASGPCATCLCSVHQRRTASFCLGPHHCIRGVSTLPDDPSALAGSSVFQTPLTVVRSLCFSGNAISGFRGRPGGLMKTEFLPPNALRLSTRPAPMAVVQLFPLGVSPTVRFLSTVPSSPEARRKSPGTPHAIMSGVNKAPLANYLGALAHCTKCCQLLGALEAQFKLLAPPAPWRQ